MFRNVSYDYRKSQIHLWETVKGERLYTVIPWVPFLFVKDDEGEFKSIEGIPVRKKTFTAYYEKKQFESRFEGRTKGLVFEDGVIPTIQFLADRYAGIPDEKLEIPELRIGITDIEVETSGEFPSWKNPNDPITIISIYDSFKDKIFTFGLKDFVETEDDCEYIKCDSEFSLLKSFFIFMKQTDFDVLSGWNSHKFDFPYLIERSKAVFGENLKFYEQLSPIGQISIWGQEKDEYKFDIAGRTYVDYLDAYQRYSTGNLENYKLDTVAQHELGSGKIDYSEYGHGAEALNKLYRENFQKFVTYNRVDVRRVKELENKLGYIKTNVYGTAHLTKTPMLYYQSQTKLIEGAMLVYFRRNGLCAPAKPLGTEVPYEGAIVKDPTPGLYEYVVDLDITSSYPSHIITLNMSNETYYGKILNLTYDEIIFHTKNRNFPDFSLRSESGQIQKFEGNRLEKFNKYLENKGFSIAPNGAVFINSKVGVIADVQRQYFAKRKEAKNKLYKLKEKVKGIEDEKQKTKLKNEIGRLNSYQNALKTILNSTYGATAVSYSRYFNPNISLAITTCGVNTIKKAEMFANEIMNSEKFMKDSKKILDKYVKDINNDGGK